MLCNVVWQMWWIARNRCPQWGSNKERRTAEVPSKCFSAWPFILTAKAEVWVASILGFANLQGWWFPADEITCLLCFKKKPNWDRVTWSPKRSDKHRLVRLVSTCPIRVQLNVIYFSAVTLICQSKNIFNRIIRHFTERPQLEACHCTLSQDLAYWKPLETSKFWIYTGIGE